MFFVIFNVVKAGPLFNDGFESGTFSNWNTAGSPTINNSPLHSGGYAADFPLGTQGCFANKTIAPTNQLNFTYYMFIGGLTTDYICVILAEDANGNVYIIEYKM